MCLYLTLLSFYSIMACGSFGFVHKDPFTGRPVYSLRYIEWEITVPVLMVLCRRKQAYGDSQSSFVRLLLTTPSITATFIYIYASWLASVAMCLYWRYALIIASFIAFILATWDQFSWTNEYSTGRMLNAIGQLHESLLAPPAPSSALSARWNAQVKLANIQLNTRMHRRWR